LQGDILLSLGNDEKALAAFYDALNYRSNYTVVLIKIGEIFFTQGNYSSAIQYFNKALTSDNTRYYLYLDIANSYLRSADYPRALYSLKEYQRFLKQYQDVKDKRYYTIAGETYFYLERFNDSIEELKKAEQSEKVLYLLGRNYYALKDFDTGLPFFNILMNRDQSEGMWYFYRAIYFYQKADYEDALSQFKQALTLNPGIFDAHYFIGKIHEINKNYRAAWESFRLFRESMTEHDELRYINEKVILPEDDYMID
jgi:tetratricopeptide (TPR) repeat protein